MVWRCQRCAREEPDGSGGYRDRQCVACGGAMAFEEAAIGWSCPRCGRTLGAMATKCDGCAQGYTRTPEGSVAVSAARCPACTVDLIERTIADVSVLGCGVCNGMMVPLNVLREWTRENAKGAPEAEGEAVVFEHDWQVHYRRCPRCVVLMNRVNFAPTTGVIVDVCPTHGFWLDAGELERIVKYVKAHGVHTTALGRSDKRELDRGARPSVPTELLAEWVEQPSESPAERLGRLLIALFVGRRHVR